MVCPSISFSFHLIYTNHANINPILGTKFNVTYDPVEKLNKGEVTELPSHTAIYSMAPKEVLQGIFSLFGKWIINGDFDVPEDLSLNAKFPEIKTTKLSEIVGAWKGH